MLKIYLKTAYRNLLKNKVYAFVNILGLAVGIAACVLIGLFVSNEKSFDNFVPNADKVYRLNEYMHYDGTAPSTAAIVGPPVAPFLKANNNEIDSYTRVFPAVPLVYPSVTMEYQGKKIKAEKLACTDTSFASMFNPVIIEGERNKFTRDQNTIVLTASLARKLFGNSPALNKTIQLRTADTTATSFTVSNVIADMPKNSHLQIEAMVPFPKEFLNSFLGTNYNVLMGATYLRISNNKNISLLESRLTKTIHTKSKFIDFTLQPLNRIHTGSVNISYDELNYKKIDGKYLNIFIVIAIAVFLIACVNFVNLTTAIAGYRGKEVAVKKIVGARRFHVVFQVLIETFFSVLLSLISALLLITIFLPLLNKLLDRELTSESIYHGAMVVVFAGILIGTTLLAGIYPAWFISRANTGEALKTKVLLGGSKSSLRNVLVTGQFAVAVIFMISLMVILKQLKYMQQRDLGYSYSQVIKLPMDLQLAKKMPVLKAEIAKVKGVKDITNGFMEMGGNGSLFGIDFIAPNGEAKKITVNMENAGINYISFFDMKMIAGRAFNKDQQNEYIINQTLAKQIGYADPVGKPINITSLPPGRIVGVVKDFNYSSLHKTIEPLIIGSMDYIPYWQTNLYVKVSGTDVSQTLKDIQKVFNSISGDNRFDYQFIDGHFNEVYHSERQAGSMIAIIGGLAMLISCLGLLSLAAFVVLRRKKEIGIRKVLGASVTNITALLSKEFLILVFIAFVVASPVAYYFMDKWLQGFAYRINIQWWVIAGAGGAAIVIAFITISFQSIKAALANPVKSLRSE
ncbi:putative ABC transport system permease protein [Mucilaginibacter gossypiicola]|uniref:Putative ABC transport system permease protein n=1 Tax=Mucilaginibacter gossypiicola TaxID=551995 RepID=A0A1H7ZH03_9SPHI|nr:ABC transporter permease [Mucilaginibacter gossypiicola]SEM56697.1 putative ABC transport system permease protein [Mucilaginibacter gossypiicola]